MSLHISQCYPESDFMYFHSILLPKANWKEYVQLEPPIPQP